MILPTVQTVRGYYRLVDSQHDMVFYSPVDPKLRPRLSVNRAEAFEKKSFRSRRVNRATLTFACPVGYWRPKPERCSGGLVVQAVLYVPGAGERVTREFMNGKLQLRHKRDQENLRARQ